MKEEKPEWVKEGSLAEWDMWWNRDRYPAEAMQSNTCMHNGLLGNCGCECECYLLGNCPTKEEIDEVSKSYIESVSEIEIEKWLDGCLEKMKGSF